MPLPLLATKLFRPPPRPHLVHRARLTERLAAGLSAGRKLTLLAAPAGFGKTTLLSEWLALRQRPTAWLALDEDDNDLPRFLSYLAAALQTLDPLLGAEALSLLEEHPPLPATTIVTALLNAVARAPHPLLLVLDDYHVLADPAIHAAVAFLLDHLPAQLHLALASRADPPLPLARLRARGELTELRAADLRFTPSEAAAFLNQVMGLNLATADLAALETRTEGWIAGLQLAAVSMQGRTDLAGFMQAFTGSHRYILDYLVEEVLQRQPDDVRRFLLHTSILDRLSGPLCAAVTGQAAAQARLLELERANLFVLALDDQRVWYRYHHLFAEVLHAHLHAAEPGLEPELHRRAAAWYDQNGAPVEAVRHALAARDDERAAHLMEAAWPAVARDRQDAVLRGWLKALPEAVVRRRPVLSVYHAGALLIGGELEAVEARLRDAEQWLAPSDPAARAPGAPLVVDAAAWRRLPTQVGVYRAALAQARGDIAGTIAHAQAALARLEPADHLGRAGAAGFLGLALWAQGDLEAAQRTFTDAMASVQLTGNVAVCLSGAVVLADMQLGLGRVREARQRLDQAGRLAAAQSLPPVGVRDLLIAHSELHRELNELDAAAQCLQQAQALGERASLSENRYRWHVAQARLLAAQGDLAGALDQLAEAEHRYLRGFYPEVRPLAALKARLWIAQGRLAEAEAWARERQLTASEPPRFLREFEHLTLARLRLAQHRAGGAAGALEEAGALLERLRLAAVAAGRVGSLTEILLLQALAGAALGRSASALAALEQALRQAEPEGGVRLFVDEGAPLVPLLSAAAQRGIAPGYVARLLAALGVPPAPSAPAPGLPEPLSPRELEVLQLLRTELTGPEIARQLRVSLNTFHTHTKNIYGKLGVKNRQAALLRAAELGLA